MNDFILSNLKIWSIVGVVEFSTQLSQVDVMMSIFVQFCGGIASLAIAWWHIFRKGRK